MRSDRFRHSPRHRAAWLLLAACLTVLPGRLALAEGDGSGTPPPGAGALEPAPAETGFDWSRSGSIALDLVLLRPLGTLASAAGLGFFAVSVPLVAPSREIGTSWEIFVLGPVEYTFERPLGEF